MLIQTSPVPLLRSTHAVCQYVCNVLPLAAIHTIYEYTVEFKSAAVYEVLAC